MGYFNGERGGRSSASIPNQGGLPNETKVTLIKIISKTYLYLAEIIEATTRNIR